MDIGGLFGNPEGYFISVIPEAELSCPEEYLKTLEPEVPTDSSSDEEAPPATEETPLVA
jgi:hypothetical protein